MKNLFRIFTTVMFFLMINEGEAQDFGEPVRQALSKLDFVIGEWEGEGWVMMPQGNRETSIVTESIHYDLDNTIITLKGLGMSERDGEKIKVHDALGVMYYDPFAKEYKMKSWLSRGMSTDANVKVEDEGNIVWWFKAGPVGTIRYTIKIRDGKWNEIGEMSQDGENWTKFFEMNLVKKS